MAPKGVKRTSSRSANEEKEEASEAKGVKRGADESTDAVEAASSGGRVRKSARKDAEEDSISSGTRRSSPPPRQLRVKLVGAGNCTRQMPDAASGGDDGDGDDDEEIGGASAAAGGDSGDAESTGTYVSAGAASSGSGTSLDVGDKAIATCGSLSFEVEIMKKDKKRAEGVSFLVRYTRFPRRGEDWVRSAHLSKWTEAAARLTSSKQPRRNLWLELDGREASEGGSQPDAEPAKQAARQSSRTRTGDEREEEGSSSTVSRAAPASRHRRNGKDDGARKETTRAEEAALLHGLAEGDGGKGGGEGAGEEDEEDGEEERDGEDDEMDVDRMEDGNSLDGDSSQDDEEEEDEMNEDNDSELSDEEDPAKLAIETGSLSPRKGPTAPGTPGLHPGTPRRGGIGSHSAVPAMAMGLSDAIKEAVHQEEDADRHRRKARPMKSLPAPRVPSLGQLRTQAVAAYDAGSREREHARTKPAENVVAAPAQAGPKIPSSHRHRKQLCPVRSFVSAV